MCLDRESLNILLRYRCVSWRSLFFWCGLNPYVLIHVTGSWWKSSIESTNFMPFRGTSKSDKLHAWQVMAQSLLPLRWFFLCPVVHNFTNHGGWKLSVASPILVRSAEVSWGDSTAAKGHMAFFGRVFCGAPYREQVSWSTSEWSLEKGCTQHPKRAEHVPSNVGLSFAYVGEPQN